MTTNRLDRELIDQLVAHRKTLGLKQREVADRCGVTTNSISQFEKPPGKRSPTLATVIRYANAVGATIGITGAAE